MLYKNECPAKPPNEIYNNRLCYDTKLHRAKPCEKKFQYINGSSFDVFGVLSSILGYHIVDFGRNGFYECISNVFRIIMNYQITVLGFNGFYFLKAVML